MPADTNPSGNIFGGWLMSQMDLGAAITARNLARCRVTAGVFTYVAIDASGRPQPVYR